ncbi:MAG: glycosyltransferase family 39 protein [Planctomycetaceae bacterium]|nr:glycosyltransferase family 39 protein [Planctomycetaceae bacterium]
MLQKQASLIFFLIAFVYFVVWTIIPFFAELNFRYDVIEMFLVGKEGVIATFKHPALNSIILELVYQHSPVKEIAPYLLNQIFFFLTAFAIWRVGCEFFSPFESLVGVLMFYGYWSYFYASLNYNHNIVSTFSWAFVILFALLAIKYDRYRYWVGLGAAIGIGFHCKITIVFIVFSILLFTLLHPATRKYWLRFGVYLSVIIALLIASPILYWLFVSDFSFMQFPIQNRLAGTFANRFYVVFDAAIIVPLLCLSFFVLFLPLSGLRWRLRAKPETNIDQIFARNFLLGTSFIAWFLMLVSCFVSVANRDLYDFTQIFIFTGLILIASFKTIQTPKAVRLFFVFFTATMACYLIGYAVHQYGAYHWRSETWYLFPGKELAVKVENLWRSKYDKPLRYVTGDWILAGNVAIYSKDRPTCHCDYGNFPISTWSTDQDVLRDGGIAIWRVENNNFTIPDRIKKRFPLAVLSEPIKLRNRAINSRNEYFCLGLAIIPPDESVKLKPIAPAPIRIWKP